MDNKVQKGCLRAFLGGSGKENVQVVVVFYFDLFIFPPPIGKFAITEY